MSANKSAITLKGSTDLVTEFFYYAVNSVLYQRGIYPPDEFEQTKKYGLPMLVSKEKGVKTFIDNIMTQSSAVLQDKTRLDFVHSLACFARYADIQKLVIVIVDAATEEVKERWAFDVDTDVSAAQSGSDKLENEIRQEIQQIIRQITASVTYLPLLESACKFDILVYTKKDTNTPQAWEESGPKLIANAEQVKLRNFSTKIHKIEPSVAYQVDL